MEFFLLLFLGCLLQSDGLFPLSSPFQRYLLWVYSKFEINIIPFVGLISIRRPLPIKINFYCKMLSYLKKSPGDPKEGSHADGKQRGWCLGQGIQPAVSPATSPRFMFSTTERGTHWSHDTEPGLLHVAAELPRSTNCNLNFLEKLY